MKKIILTLCLFAATSMATQTLSAAETNKTELSAQQPKNNNQKDSKSKKTNYASEYTKQETEVKRLYRELNEEKNNSRKYTELKKEFSSAQTELRSIRTTAKRYDVKITASKWETVKVK
ncbi:MAG: hypothetical protein R3Y49_02890 [Rikenellaceae bacterium]